MASKNSGMPAETKTNAKQILNKRWRLLRKLALILNRVTTVTSLLVKQVLSAARWLRK